MKHLLRFLLLALVIIGFSSCSSTGTSTTASGDPVPGEKTVDNNKASYPALFTRG